MATLREIKQRIKGIKSTQQITKAMKMVAAAKMRRAQENMYSARPYATKIQELIQNLVSAIDESGSPFLQDRPVKHITLIVVTGDRGLCGSFNGNAIKKALQEFDEYKGKEVSLICVGKKGYEFFRKRDYKISANYVGVFNVLDFSYADQISNFLIEEFLAERTDAVKIVFNEFKSAAQQNLVSQSILPFSGLEAVDGEEAAKQIDYLYEPSQEALLDALLPRFIKTQVWRGLLESYAAEQAARMMAMENATENAKELIRDLTLQYNKARQASITKEILEIVGGAEALKSE